MSNELRVHHSAGVWYGTRPPLDCRPPLAATLWYIYRLIIELVGVTIMKLGECQALRPRRVRGATASACARCVTLAADAPRKRAAFRFYLASQQPIRSSPVIHFIHINLQLTSLTDIFLPSASAVAT